MFEEFYHAALQNLSSASLICPKHDMSSFVLDYERSPQEFSKALQFCFDEKKDLDALVMGLPCDSQETFVAHFIYTLQCELEHGRTDFRVRLQEYTDGLISRVPSLNTFSACGLVALQYDTRYNSSGWKLADID